MDTAFPSRNFAKGLASGRGGCARAPDVDKDLGKGMTVDRLRGEMAAEGPKGEMAVERPKGQSER